MATISKATRKTTDKYCLETIRTTMFNRGREMDQQFEKTRDGSALHLAAKLHRVAMQAMRDQSRYKK